MKQIQLISWSFLLLGIFLVICGCQQEQTETKDVVAEVLPITKSFLPYYNEATFTPKWMDTDNANLDTFHQIMPFVLINQEGDTITESTFENKIYITDFFFTVCPGICPRMTKNMASLQEKFKDNSQVLFLSHSVTPTRDSVPVLKKYADEKGVIAGKWHLVTGDRDLIYELGRKAYFVEEDLGLEKDLDEFLHTENFVLIDQNRHIRGIYNGLNKSSLAQLEKDVVVLLEN